jgi:rare lipoprotein A
VGEYFRQEGIASWYGNEFNGRPTASGEIYNSSLLTAAHPTLPFGTILLVTNRQNNRQVAVKVNDRGPFVASRIIDLSRAAAEQLDMLITGTAPVVIDKIQASQLYAPQAVLPPVTTLPPQVALPPPTALPPQAVLPPPTALPPQAFQQPPGYFNIQQVPMIYTQQPIQTLRLPPLPLPPQQFQTPAPVPSPEMPSAMSSYPPITVTVYPPQSSAAPSPMDLPGGPRAKLSPSINPVPGRIYKLQVGSYKVAGNAVDAYVKLKAAGLEPSYERKDDYFRVVLAGIRGTDVTSVAEKLGTAGFREAVIREE